MIGLCKLCWGMPEVSVTILVELLSTASCKSDCLQAATDARDKHDASTAQNAWELHYS
jgi:hypothetical protein